ncbi:cell division protein SepF [Bifidobacterium choloepi]|uniref:Cell division protein SepF n=1 Tax=Bifidobacterium choloepi TaxID=2614131 RepID=A0A6I5N2Y4_9BIFI|nr:cell division protein SepF [Bifidobacterium choloepi]NEG70019.1 cell division protein SepF [Bifidobacterium choloepi]
MAGFMKNAMSYLGMSDVVDDDDEYIEEVDETETGFDTDHSVTPMPASGSPSLTAVTGSAGSSTSSAKATNPFQGRLSRITTIHPQSYEDAQLVGRALRDGTPVVLNLTGVAEPIAYRIVDFSSGVVFGLSGSIERVTPRVFLLSPAQVNIVTEETDARSQHDLFAD